VGGLWKKADSVASSFAPAYGSAVHRFAVGFRRGAKAPLYLRGKGKSNGKSNAKGKGKGNGKSNGKGNGKSNAKGNGKSNAKGNGKGKGKGNGNSTGKGNGNSTGKGNGNSTGNGNGNCNSKGNRVADRWSPGIGGSSDERQGFLHSAALRSE
jgi:hypothetical protein